MKQPQPWMAPQTVWLLPPALKRLETLAAGFKPISLGDMEDVALLNRIDTKFLMTTSQLLRVLAGLQPDYWLLDVDGQRLNHYRTLYFDTPGFDLYLAHVNERPERFKVRAREYVDSRLSFFEVKHRTRKDRTIKERVQTSQPARQITSEMSEWLGSVAPLAGCALRPTLWNTFTRITLVNKDCCERVTLDFDLTLSACNRFAQLEGIAIAEVKVDAARGRSPLLAQMRSMHIPRRGFSKYAMGVVLLYDGVKKNTLKSKLIWLEKMMKGSQSYE